MELKYEILCILESHRGSYVNGASLANHLQVTRAAIWKVVKSLQEDGYQIHAIRNKGYCLDLNNDILSYESIAPYLIGKAKDFIIQVHPKVTSTNTMAKNLANEHAPHGTVIIAHEQTEGRGRLGRSFYSPKGTGIYMSILLRPTINLEDSLQITTNTAVIVARAIDKLTGQNSKIKWVNDIYLDQKKVCGILTEASVNYELGMLDYAIVGIGINVSTSNFPESLQSIAGSLLQNRPSHPPISSQLVAEIINQMAYLEHSLKNELSQKVFKKEYRERSLLIGNDIYVHKGNDCIEAKALDIDDKARLIVQYKDESIEILNSGEVSIKPLFP